MIYEAPSAILPIKYIICVRQRVKRFTVRFVEKRWKNVHVKKWEIGLFCNLNANIMGIYRKCGVRARSSSQVFSIQVTNILMEKIIRFDLFFHFWKCIYAFIRVHRKQNEKMSTFWSVKVQHMNIPVYPQQYLLRLSHEVQGHLKISCEFKVNIRKYFLLFLLIIRNIQKLHMICNTSDFDTLVNLSTSMMRQIEKRNFKFPRKMRKICFFRNFRLSSIFHRILLGFDDGIGYSFEIYFHTTITDSGYIHFLNLNTNLGFDFHKLEHLCTWWCIYQVKKSSSDSI